MRFRTLAISAALAAGIISTASAYAPQKGAERPVVSAGRSPRLHRDVTFTAPHGVLAGLPTWRAMWDRDTDVPLRLWGPAIMAPGASGSASTAEAFARLSLASHIDVLAPGATTSDFVLLANQTSPDGALRTVTFQQRAQGLNVVGGAVAFTFSHDKLMSMASTALPHVAVRMPAQALPVATVANAARSWLGAAGYAVDVKAYGDRVIIPIVAARGNAPGPDIEYRVAESLTVESTREPGLWTVWIDSSDASPIARATQLHFASGTVLYDVPERWPGGTRTNKPAPNVTHGMGTATATSDANGVVTWATGTSTTVAPGLVGPYVRITNKAGALVTDSLTLTDGGSVVWSKAADEFADAQLIAFMSASAGKAFAKSRLNPSLAWFDQQIPVYVNETQTCNAYSTGNDVHFFRANTQCNNTGRLTDVVYHEFGHSVHNQSIIPGVGAFDGSLSEGLADTMAASITKDHGMGRGFFFNDQPLRELDPDGVEKKWPDDADGEVHDEGEIIGEALWDLRKALQAKLGVDAGENQTLKLFYGVMQRASDIPSSYLAALETDDNDGDLSNGTPNQCEINAAFAPHGLVDPAVTLGLAPPVRDGYKVSITVKPPAQSSCPPPNVASVTLTWTPQTGTGGEIQLAASGDTWSANIPTQPDGTVITYHVTVALSDGSSMTFPQNPADPEYQMYAGNVEKIWCADFETGASDWTFGGMPAANVEWEAGAPMGVGGDPKTAHGGANVLGIDLGSDDGLYSPRTTQYAVSPEIDLGGRTDVRLQYYRWLNVEDGVYDPATISANDTVVWTNKASPMQSQTEVNHTDREWRFHDVDLSAQAASGKIKLKFQIVSDPGLELGGWTMDDVCIVAKGAPSQNCGNGNVDDGETCDDGNTTDGDGCSATCQTEGTGGGGDGGCCSAGTNPAGPLALSFLTIGLVIRRRRRK